MRSPVSDSLSAPLLGGRISVSFVRLASHQRRCHRENLKGLRRMIHNGELQLQQRATSIIRALIPSNAK